MMAAGHTLLNDAGAERWCSDAGTFVLSESALDMHCWGLNPVVVAKLQLNGQDRFSEREGSYFDQVQPFQHHTRAPDSGINRIQLSPFAPKNTNLPEVAISPVLITPLYNLFFPTLPLTEPALPRYVSTPLTTMSFVS